MQNKQTRFLLLSTFAFTLASSPIGAQEITVRVKVDGQTVDGSPLAWSDERIYLLLRDGRTWDFPPDKATDFQKTSSTFRSYSQAEIRRQLLMEFGREFEVSGTGQFLVVHPAGARDQWARRFEDLYRSFQHYFSVRGLQPRTPPFPFVAIVFHNQTDFLKYSAGQGVRIGAGVLGYYSPSSNRILLYDQSGGNDDETAWLHNGAIIIHEASHQSAFNTGIHNRFAPPPRWVGEGLGTLFEAPGVWDSRNHPSQSERINRGRFLQFKEYMSTRYRKGALPELISSDRLFTTDAAGAYAQSWALTFYLTETLPKDYFSYLAKTGDRKPFTEYRSTERLNDFTTIFGGNFAMLEARLIRFIDGLE